MGRIYTNCPAVNAALQQVTTKYQYRNITREEREMADKFDASKELQKAVKQQFDFAMSSQMHDFDKIMKPLTIGLMKDHDIPDRFNGVSENKLHLSNIDAVVRQALWIGFLHGKGWQDE